MCLKNRKFVAFTTYNPIPATGKIILQIAQEDAII